MEYKILKLLTNREFYDKHSSIISPKLFSKDIASLYNTIIYIFNKYSCTNISIDELYSVHLDINQLTRAKIELVDIIFNKLRSTELPNEELAADLLKSMYRRNLYLDLSELCAKGINESADVSEQICERVNGLSNIDTPDRTTTATSTDILGLLDATSPTNAWALCPSELTGKLHGVVRGNLLVVFGRPEVGKSSYIGALAGNFLTQGLRVDYFANEEPTPKIALNVVRNILGKSDKELQADREKNKASYPKWDEVRERFKLYDAVGVSASEIDTHAKNNSPDVIILDQADKIRIDGTYSDNHSKLKDLYIYTREIAKRRDCVVINVSQASYDAQDKREVTYDMLDGSKTGKAAEADIIIGIGKDPGMDEQLVRYLTVSKNKNTGWHGVLPVNFNPWTNQWG